VKQYVQTDLEADRQVANTLATLIIGGPLATAEVMGEADKDTTDDPGGDEAAVPLASDMQKAPSLIGRGL